MIPTQTSPSTLVRRTLVTPASELRVRETGADGAATDGRTITGYAILFNTPSAPLWTDDNGADVREVIAPEAVTRELLDESDIKFTMYHDRQLLLGRSCRGKGTLSYFIDERGVGFDLSLPCSPNGDEALELVRRGDIAGCSFAFTTRYWDSDCVERTIDPATGGTLYTVRVIDGIHDFTLAADPAYPDTSVEHREFLAALRGASHPSDSTPPDSTTSAPAESVAAMRRESLRPML